MSGGSYDYLYSKFETAIWDFVRHLDDVREMAKDMREYGYPEGAKILENMVKEMDVSRDAFTSDIQSLMRAFEWWTSADTLKLDFENTLKGMLGDNDEH